MTISQQYKPIKPALKEIFKELMPGLGNTSFKIHADEYFINYYRVEQMPTLEKEIERFKRYLITTYHIS